MTKKLTLDQFIERAISKHGDNYDYSKSVYISNSVKVEIFCKKHSLSFLQSPNKHMAGQGCPLCRYNKSSNSNKSCREDFIKSAIKIHGSKYDYSEVVYTDCFTQVEIKCNTHGILFRQKPTHHVGGSGCPVCAKQKIVSHIDSLKLTTEDFISKAITAHGDAYDYTNSVYTKASDKVKIWCNNHQGYFEQTANVHLAGSGCASCAKTGYSTNKPGELYVLVSDNITKIGITNFKSADRSKKVSKSSGKEFKVKFKMRFTDGAIADSIETSMLRELRKKYLQPVDRFEGQSECFLNVEYAKLMQLFNKELSKIGAYQIDNN